MNAKSKILKPYTIIPPDLYVRRDADRQVDEIIRDMGRPGYVLVARQMGKTNLILNAKRRLQTPADAFIYVDLSNEFESAQACFENIIDVAIDTHQEKFSEVAEIIREKRDSFRQMPPHKQHTTELRLLLRAIGDGKLVIILDEIDALTKTDYSDQIFSQIRSSYFASRVNYKEFNNLTYLLSGVAEPSEIIRDPKVSPFNIGQKIYLNDFSNEEFEQFIIASKLDISLDVKNRIYFWTSGNPRITWDVCSEVEDRLKVQSVDVEAIDAIINECYLTTFDKPPIDNIRELVSKDKEIRNSVVEISYKKGREISDKLKGRLYLTGIINYDSSNVKIKNEIISRSLSIEWIRGLEEQERGIFKVAFDYFDNARYDDCISAFKRFLADNPTDSTQTKASKFYLGVAYTRTKQYSQAIEWLSQLANDPTPDNKLRCAAAYNVAISNHRIGNRKESIELFKTCIECYDKSVELPLVLVNYAITLLSTSTDSNVDLSLQILNRLIDNKDHNGKEFEGVVSDEIQSTALYYLAKQSASIGEIEVAVNHFRSALKLAKPEMQPTIVLEFLSACQSADEKIQIVDDLFATLENHKLIPSESPIDAIGYSVDVASRLALFCYIHSKGYLFEKIKFNKYLKDEKRVGIWLYNLAVFAIARIQILHVAQEILNDLLSNLSNPEYEIDEKTRYSSIKLGAYIAEKRNSTQRRKEYFLEFERGPITPIDSIDFSIFATQMHFYTDSGQFESALKCADLLHRVAKTKYEDTMIDSLVIYNLEAALYLRLGNTHKAIEKANLILELVDSDLIKRQNSNLLGETGLDEIQKSALYIASFNGEKRVPMSSTKRFGRNELVYVKYKSGKTIQAKFKRVESDIASGACQLVDLDVKSAF